MKMIKNVWAVYFSPSGSTEKVVRRVARAAAETLGIKTFQIYDWTLPGQREKELTFSEEDLVILASPTYAGRVPNKIMPFVRDSIKGGGAAGVAVAAYGNRSYDDALMELYLLMKDNGFRMTGAGAVVCRHVMSEVLAAGRPSEEDLEEAAAFGRHIADKFLQNDAPFSNLMIPGNLPVGPYYKPLEEDGRPASFLKAKPQLNSEICDKCGVCASVCPMGSINPEDVEEVTGVCIKCHACVRKCPLHARYFSDPSLLSHIRMLENNY
ncbi:MAG: 4Fe-4S binding protein, partial [Coprococcus sp.]